MASRVIDRSAALYYPYIHVPTHKIDWLKATLLCFPQVRRMIPEGFNPRDAPEIWDFRDVMNAAGEPLFDSEYLNLSDSNSAPAQAQERLLRNLWKHKDSIVARFAGRGRNSRANLPDNYTIHREKVRDDIWKFLRDNNLAKAAGRKANDPYGEWLHVEPELGNAIMSTIAIAVAKAKGLDIVTSDSEFHDTVVIQSEDEVFNRLLNLSEPSVDTSEAEKAEELAQIVIQARFDVSQLTALQIAELHKEGKGLMAFKEALLPIAAQIPNIGDPKEREKQFRRKADEVIETWEKYKRKLPGFAAAALVEAQETKPPEYALSLMAAGGTAIWIPAAGLAITLGVLSYKGYKIVQKFREGTANPYKYLTQIERKGATLVAAPPK